MRRVMPSAAAAACLLLAGCLSPDPTAVGPSPPPPPPATVPTVSPEADALLEKGRALFDAGRYELAAAAFEGAATDHEAAIEATAFLERTRVLLGRAPVESWHIDPKRAAHPAMAARIRVEVRWLLNEARRLIDAGRQAEADIRLRRASQLVQAVRLEPDAPSER